MREEKTPDNTAEVSMLKHNKRKRGGKQLCREGPWGATVQPPLSVEYGVFQFFRARVQFLLATKLKQELTQVIELELKLVWSSCPTQSCSWFILGYLLYSWNWSEINRLGVQLTHVQSRGNWMPAHSGQKDTTALHSCYVWPQKTV